MRIAKTALAVGLLAALLLAAGGCWMNDDFTQDRTLDRSRYDTTRSEGRYYDPATGTYKYRDMHYGPDRPPAPDPDPTPGRDDRK